MAAMLFDERRVARPGAAAEVGHRDGLALQQGRRGHAAILALRARRSNRKQHVEQGLAADARCAPSIDSSRRLEMAPPLGEILSA